MSPPVQLRDLIARRRWTVRSAFPPSRPIGGRLFTLGNGMFLMTNPLRGDDDPVWGVGWAESDYWAERAWSYPNFAGDLTSPPPEWRPLPSLAFMGRPTDLSLGSVVAFERSRLHVPKVTRLNARYRTTDGAFVQYNVEGSDDVKYIFGAPQPKSTDEPVAIEFRLREQGPSRTAL